LPPLLLHPPAPPPLLPHLPCRPASPPAPCRPHPKPSQCARGGCHPNQAFLPPPRHPPHAPSYCRPHLPAPAPPSRMTSPPQAPRLFHVATPRHGPCHGRHTHPHVATPCHGRHPCPHDLVPAARSMPPRHSHRLPLLVQLLVLHRMPPGRPGSARPRTRAQWRGARRPPAAPSPAPVRRAPSALRRHSPLPLRRPTRPDTTRPPDPHSRRRGRPRRGA
jgi:hypothetical protein